MKENQGIERDEQRESEARQSRQRPRGWADGRTSDELSADVNFRDASAASQRDQVVLHSITVRQLFQVDCGRKRSSEALG